MISTLHWVPKGAAKAEPEQYELSPEDLKALQEKFEQQFVFSICQQLCSTYIDCINCAQVVGSR
jgi:hypothetical protein